jgi:3-mercaptopyruvate sulfurtransferase SseA
VDFAFVKQAVAWTEYVIIDCRSKELFEKGSVLKAVNLERSEVMGDHSALKSEDVNKVLKDKKLNLGDKNIILFGCAASNVKAVFEYYGTTAKKVQIYEGGYAEWKDRYVPPPVTQEPAKTTQITEVAKPADT